MKPQAGLAAAATIAILAGCGTTATPSAGGNTTAAPSCHQQYRTWKVGPARAIVKHQLGPALKAVQSAGSVQDLPKMRAALERTGHVGAELAAYPIPRCADPKGYWSRILALFQAAGDNARSSSGLGAILLAVGPLREVAVGPLREVKVIEGKLGAELKKTAGI